MDQIGRYRIVGELGRGAMGVVYRAEDPAIGRTVAIKTIRLSDLADPNERQFMRERLLREARSAGILSHPGIVTIYDIFEEGDTAYVFMEFVNGDTLESKVTAAGALNKEKLFDVLRQTAAALDYAHGKGIVHRDIKPANIMISVDGEAKITDFGVAKILSQQMTQTRSVLGTPYYMSPEQIQGGKIDGQSDQFALAVIAYELITGERPYSADTLPALLFKIVKEMPVPPNRVNASLAPEAGAVFEKAFAKDPAARYSSCTEFVSALGVAANRRPDWRPLARGDAGKISTAIPAADKNAANISSEAPTMISKPSRLAAPAGGGGQPVLPQMPKVRDRSVLLAENEGSNLGRNILVVLLLMAVAAAGAYYAYNEFLRPPPPTDVASLPIPLTGEPTPAVKPESGFPAPPLPEPTATGETAASESPATTGQNPGQSAATASAVPQPPPVKSTPETAAPSSLPPVKLEPKPTPTPAAPVKPKEYWVQIRSNPPGADVSVDKDGELRCKTPCELPLRTGRHVVNLSMAGRRLAPRIIRVPELTDLTVNLDRLAGTLAVRSTPPGATIYINGEKRPEQTPAMVKLPAGTYKIRLTLPGRPEFNDSVSIKDQVITSVGVEW